MGLSAFLLWSWLRWRLHRFRLSLLSCCTSKRLGHETNRNQVLLFNAQFFPIRRVNLPNYYKTRLIVLTVGKRTIPVHNYATKSLYFSRLPSIPVARFRVWSMVLEGRSLWCPSNSQT